jgi:hypothetical protein
MRNQRPAPACDGPLTCGAAPAVRNRYFTGKYMTARDFAAEQEYFIGRHRLHNRLFHGWGIVCGLEVEHHSAPGCRERWVIVRAGIAIDCCGRELVLPEDTVVELPLPWEAPATAESCRVYGAPPPEGSRYEPFLICLRYAEDPCESVPVLYGDGCPPHQQEANRVREKVKIDFCDVTPECWPARPSGCGGAEAATLRAGACLTPECPCGEMVPIALIDFACDKPDKGFCIHTAGAQTAQRLTHIAETSWEHGGIVDVNTLVTEWKGRLTVTFDRPLAPPDGEATGINRFTFTVQSAEHDRHLEFVPASRGTPALEPDDPRTAVYWIHPNALLGLAGETVYVTLRCDFILDSRGLPVDGDHLAGRLPTGDGVCGGVFESWFRVTHNGNGGPRPGGGGYNYDAASEEAS